MAKKLRKLFFLSFTLSVFGFCYWLVYIALAPNLPNSDQPIYFYSNQCQNNIKHTLVQAIERAQRSIYVVMFGLTDPKILSSLNRKSSELSKMKIYYDPRASIPAQNLFLKSDVTPIRKSGYMHQKILITDDQTVFLGSTNFTPTSLVMHDNFLIGIYNPQLAQFLQKKTPLGSGCFQNYLDHQHFKLWLLPDKTQKALEDLLHVIFQANEKIQIAMFTLTHPLLVDALIRMKLKGVDIQVIIDAQSGYGCSMQSIKRLKKANVSVFLSSSIQLMHHKMMWVDENILVTGSANWTKAAFEKNQDYYFILSPLTSDQRLFCKKLFQNLETELTNPDFLE